MNDRKYSVKEIDAMRMLIENKFLYGSYRPDFKPGITYSSRSYKADEGAAVVEQELRTAMLAGLGPDDF